MHKVAFLCVANVCRSPAMHGVFQHIVDQKDLTDQFYIDSFAISPCMLGSDMNSKMQKTLFDHGILFQHSAQMFEPHLFDFFDHILVATESVQAHLKELAEPKYHPKIKLMTAFSSKYKGNDIPDPYAKGYDAFEQVFEMIEESSIAFFQTMA